MRQAGKEERRAIGFDPASRTEDSRSDAGKLERQKVKAATACPRSVVAAGVASWCGGSSSRRRRPARRACTASRGRACGGVDAVVGAAGRRSSSSRAPLAFRVAQRHDESHASSACAARPRQARRSCRRATDRWPLDASNMSSGRDVAWFRRTRAAREPLPGPREASRMSAIAARPPANSASASPARPCSSHRVSVVVVASSPRRAGVRRRLGAGGVSSPSTAAGASGRARSSSGDGGDGQSRPAPSARPLNVSHATRRCRSRASRHRRDSRSAGRRRRCSVLVHARFASAD